MLFAFSMSVEVAKEFYRRATEANATTEEERNEILLEMVREELIKDVVVTERSKEQYISDLSKNFNVLKVDKNDPESI